MFFLWLLAIGFVGKRMRGAMQAAQSSTTGQANANNPAGIFDRVATQLIGDVEGFVTSPTLTVLPPITYRNGGYFLPTGEQIGIGTVFAIRLDQSLASSYGTSGQVVAG